MWRCFAVAAAAALLGALVPVLASSGAAVTFNLNYAVDAQLVFPGSLARSLENSATSWQRYVQETWPPNTGSSGDLSVLDSRSYVLGDIIAESTLFEPKGTAVRLCRLAPALVQNRTLNGTYALVQACPCGQKSNCERTSILFNDLQSAGALGVLLIVPALPSQAVIYLQRVFAFTSPSLPIVRLRNYTELYFQPSIQLSLNATAAQLEEALTFSPNLTSSDRFVRCDAARVLWLNTWMAAVLVLWSFTQTALIYRNVWQHQRKLLSKWPALALFSACGYATSELVNAAVVGASCTNGCIWTGVVAWSFMWYFVFTLYTIISFMWTITLSEMTLKFYGVTRRHLEVGLGFFQLCVVTAFFLRILFPFYANGDLISAVFFSCLLFLVCALMLIAGGGFLRMLKMGTFSAMNAAKARTLSQFLVAATLTLTVWMALQLTLLAAPLTVWSICPIAMCRDITQSLSVALMLAFIYAFTKARRADATSSTGGSGVNSDGNSVDDTYEGSRSPRVSGAPVSPRRSGGAAKTTPSALKA